MVMESAPASRRRRINPSFSRLAGRRIFWPSSQDPECQFGDERFVATEVTDPNEYVRLYALAKKVYAGYGDYRAKTAPIGRQIPIFRLEPR